MKNVLIAVSLMGMLASVACTTGTPRRGGAAGASGGTAGASGTAGAGTAGAGTAGDTSGTAGAGTAGAGTAGDASGAAGAGTAGAGTAGAGTAGDPGAAGAGTAGAGTAGAGTAGAGTAGDQGGTAGATVMVCNNSTVVTAGGAEANCPAKTTWKASGMPAAAKGYLGIPDNQLLAQYAIDGSTTTRFTSGMTMADGWYFQVDLGAAKKISGIVVTTTMNKDATYDVADGYEVGVSMDGTAFTKVAGCTSSAAPIETINFTATMARYVRYTNKGAPVTPTNSPTAWLSIHEFNVLCNN